MVSRTFVIKNEQGLHARPANLFVKECLKYSCGIKLVKSGRECNAKSILQILTMSVNEGSEIEIICAGEDENEAMAGISGLIEAGFEV